MHIENWGARPTTMQDVAKVVLRLHREALSLMFKDQAHFEIPATWFASLNADAVAKLRELAGDALN